MAGDWIKVQTCTPDKPEVHLIAEQLGIDPDAVTGKLIRIWCWADQQTIDGNAVSVTKTLLDRVACVTGFAQCLLKVGWLVETESGFQFPNFDRHNGNSAKTRGLSAKRTEKHRKSAPECNAPTVTTALPEKRREEKSISNTETQGETPVVVKLKKPSSVFQKPTVQRIIAYVLEIGATVDAKQFWDYYESIGWKVGRNGNAMKDWQAAVRQWQARNKQQGYANARTGYQTAAEKREQLNASGFDIIRQAAAEAAALASGNHGGNLSSSTGKTLFLEEHGAIDSTCV